ncbi:MAG: hypothetical protein ACREU4_00080 [Burkholderiales bacterium]
MANRGTLFLDEVGDIPLELQRQDSPARSRELNTFDACGHASLQTYANEVSSQSRKSGCASSLSDLAWNFSRAGRSDRSGSQRARVHEPFPSL